MTTSEKKEGKETLKAQNQQQESLPSFSSPTPGCRSGPVCSPPAPPFFQPSQSRTDLCSPFLWPRTPSIQPVFCENCCISRCTPHLAVERDALHDHLLFHHLASPTFISLKERIYCHFWFITFCFSFYDYRCICWLPCDQMNSHQVHVKYILTWVSFSCFTYADFIDSWCFSC